MMMMMRLDMPTEEELSEEQTLVVKRKRTKRPRPSSSSSSGMSTDQEDEDMANCLILLARGFSPPPENKTGSRKFAEMSTTAAGGGKVGIYVYECKTCSRTFPSFQALGGHRASHKRPKLAAAADTDQKTSPPAGADGIENDEKAVICHVKIHECSICGSEFASGQALGGHMRRHRTAAAAATAVDDVSVKHRNMLALDLDLNLPAPPEDVGKFSQFSAKATFFSAAAAATAALVDCHY